MQKLGRRNTYTPLSTSLAQCNCDSELNKEEILSVQNLKTCANNPEVNRVQQTERPLQSKVFVLSKQGKPLMPCSYAKSKRMVKKGCAKVVKRFPFTIQLNFDCEDKIQDVTLGIDTGYSNIGFSAVSEKSELISGTLILENGMTKRLQEKAMYRRGRRNQLWYRKPRWANRGIPKGWLPPSVNRRFQTHVSLIERIKKLLPISKIRIEVANFDIQKIENPSIEGTGYQQGTMYEYRNRIAYLIAREKGKCQYCDKEYQKNNGWRLHHIWGKEKDRPSDWALLHEKCHGEIHEKHLEKILQDKKSKSYKDSTFMSIVRWKFKETFPKAEITYGNITFQNRCDLDIEKSHVNDAFVIAEGKNQIRINPFEIIQKKRNNRCLQINRKGFKPFIRKQHYKIQPQDLVWIGKKEYISKGTHCKGTRIVLENLGSKSMKLITKYFNTNGWRWQTNSSPA